MTGKLSGISYGLSGLSGTLNGIPAILLADSGSDFNIITLACASTYYMEINTSTRDADTIPIANGSELQIIGRTVAEWIFGDSPDQIHLIDFEVVLQCTQNAIVGYHFLQKTGSFEKQKKSRFCRMPCSRANGLLVYRIGAVYHRLTMLARPYGERDWNYLQAFPDSGAQGNIMSAASVHVYGLTIRSSDTVFIFPDGTEQKSLGRVKMQLSLGSDGAPITTIFEIMRRCPYDVILGHDFVFDHHVYSDHAHLLMEANSKGRLNLIATGNRSLTEGLRDSFQVDRACAKALVDPEFARKLERSQLAHHAAGLHPSRQDPKVEPPPTGTNNRVSAEDIVDRIGRTPQIVPQSWGCLSRLFHGLRRRPTVS